MLLPVSLAACPRLKYMGFWLRFLWVLNCSFSCSQNGTGRTPHHHQKNGPPWSREPERAVITVGGHRVPTLYRIPDLAQHHHRRTNIRGEREGGTPSQSASDREGLSGAEGRQRFGATTGQRTGNPSRWEGALLGFCETRQCETAQARGSTRASTNPVWRTGEPAEEAEAGAAVEYPTRRKRQAKAREVRTYTSLARCVRGPENPVFGGG